MSIRARIGLMVPASTGTAEPDFGMAALRNVGVHSQRMWNVNELAAEVMEG
jgi:maleate cis-trans isomerase